MIVAIVCAAVLGYFTVAAVFARGRLKEWYSDPDGLPLRYRSDANRRRDALIAVGLGSIWPGLLIVWAVDAWLVKPVIRWLWRPVVQAEERYDRLRRDLDTWQGKRRAGTEEEKRMAADIIPTLEELLGRRR